MGAALDRIGLAPPLESLFGYGFITHAASRSYTLAGSFCRYLMERRGGASRLAEVYRSGGDFQAAYGRPLDALLEEWERWLGGVEVPAPQLQLASERFRRPSVLRRVCSHEVANLDREADEHAAGRRFDEAAATYAQICHFDPYEPTHLLSWARLTAAAGRTDEAQEILQRLLEHPSLSKPLLRRALEYGGDLRWLEGQVRRADDFYRRAGELAGYPGDRRVLYLKRWALQQREAIRRLVLSYLVKRPGEAWEAGLEVHLAYSLQRELPRSGLGLYLVGKQLAAKDHCSASAEVLRRALEAGLPNADFEIEAHRTLGRCQYRAFDLLGAEGTFEALLRRSDLASGTRLEGADWLERVRWRRGAAMGSPLATPLSQ
jgi:tetratricopeptide (TPR) repeat protein